jgi:gamma-glutamylcyclotransferase (GGCT)/AIG2-like uncharacterized protein YtfP
MTEQINTNRGTSSPEKKGNYTNIFVYGSLRKGMGLNPVRLTQGVCVKQVDVPRGSPR